MAKKFTLLELIVVIAVLTVLAGLLLPLPSRARDGAKDTGCLANLKQIGAAEAQYVGDNDNWQPVNHVIVIKESGRDSFQNSTAYLLAAYADPDFCDSYRKDAPAEGDGGVFRCPNDSRKYKYYNCSYGAVADQVHHHSTYAKWVEQVPYKLVKNSAALMSMMDGRGNVLSDNLFEPATFIIAPGRWIDDTWYNGDGPFVTDTDGDGLPDSPPGVKAGELKQYNRGDFRHEGGKKINAVMADSHVEGITKAQFIELRRWGKADE